MGHAPQGFWEVVGFEPYVYAENLLTTATFATKAAAEKFAAEKGGQVRHRNADGTIVDGKIVPIDI